MHRVCLTKVKSGALLSAVFIIQGGPKLKSKPQTFVHIFANDNGDFHFSPTHSVENL